MRTTLTLDADVAALLSRLLRVRKTTLKQLVNDALRQGLQLLSAPRPKRRRFVIEPFPPSELLVPNLDNVEEVLDWVEGPDRR